MDRNVPHCAVAVRTFLSWSIAGRTTLLSPIHALSPLTHNVYAGFIWCVVFATLCYTILAGAWAQDDGRTTDTLSETAQLDGTIQTGDDVFSLGSLSPDEGALPPDLWQGETHTDLSFLFDTLPGRYDSLAYTRALKRVLLSPGAGPEGVTASLAAQKLMVLARAGYYEEAAALATLSRALEQRSALSQVVAYAEMMRGDMEAACRRGVHLTQGRGEPFWLKLRVFCYVDNAESAAADVTLSLLRDRGGMVGQEEKLLNALVAGKVPKGDFIPDTVFAYAAIRELGLSIGPEDLQAVDGAVWRALALDTHAAQNMRLYAARYGVYAQIVSPAELVAIYESVTFDAAQLETARRTPDKAITLPLGDALMYQVIQQMQESNTRLAQADLLGKILRSTRTPAHFTALAYVYAPVTSMVEVIAKHMPYAPTLALAGIVTGDHALAEKWIEALAANQANSDTHPAARAMLGLLSIRAPAVAARIAASVEIVVPDVVPALFTTRGLHIGAPQEALPRLLDIGFDAVASGRKAQAALVALCVAGIKTDLSDDALRQVIIVRALAAAGLMDVVHALSFEEQMYMVFDTFIVQPARAAVSMGTAAASQGPQHVAAGRASAQVLPRVKPARAQ